MCLCESSIIEQRLSKNQSQVNPRQLRTWRITDCSSSGHVQPRSQRRVPQGQASRLFPPKPEMHNALVCLRPCLSAQRVPLCEDKPTPLLKWLYCHLLENLSSLKGPEHEQCSLELCSLQSTQLCVSFLLWQDSVRSFTSAESTTNREQNKFVSHGKHILSWFSLLNIQWSRIKSKSNELQYLLGQRGEGMTAFPAPAGLRFSWSLPIPGD